MPKDQLLPAIVVLLLFAASSAYADDSLELKGLKIGSTADELRTKYPELVCSDPKQEAKRPLNKKLKEFWERKQTEADLFCETTINDRNPPTALSVVAGHRINAIDFHFIADRLMYGYASLDSMAFDDLIADLTIKYGPPTRKDTEAVHARTGAKFTNKIFYWKRAGATIQVSKYAVGLDTASYSLCADDYWPEVARRRAAQAKATGKSP
ncbi:MAG TPA: hypothetical protein VEI74_05400 [Candidatus Methylomirabilis sp.]|nr:hypothetical protein [Candidatus Methylomirabilis sp.]